MRDDKSTGLSYRWPPPNMDEIGRLPRRRRLPTFKASRAAALPNVGPDPEQRRTILLCAIAVAAGTAAMLLLVIPSHDAARQSTANPQFTFPAPSAAVSLLPPPASPSSQARTTTASASLPARHLPASAKPSRTVIPAFTPQLIVGATVGLEVAGKPGLRVRHQDFFARVDQFSSTSSALDKADAEFIVRKGLAFDGCVSFEAVSHPGYFLRRFFGDLVLHQQRSSPIYEQEATFCPIPTRDGKGLTLLVLLPSGFTVAAAPDGRLHLDSPDKTAPTTFVVRKPL